MILTINMIAAVCANNGIGYKGDLPWKLKLVVNNNYLYTHFQNKIKI